MERAGGASVFVSKNKYLVFMTALRTVAHSVEQ